MKQDTKPYTVLLLYPDYIASNYGQETYSLWVEAINPEGAVAEAQEEACRDVSHTDADDFYPLAVYEGWLNNLALI
ncbi:MAG: hypothetical protein RBU21_02965 [FCB group bacterium]|jgi:hypothetical protein|nr:hypothetical protein [FCB group bacterium]